MEGSASILHADLDAFYASVEQLLDPSLRGKPIAVGGGVVLAASYEAKAFGRSRWHVRGGGARELCPQLRFVAGHFDAYQRLGDAALSLLSDYTPLVERLSIDEAFADVAGVNVCLVRLPRLPRRSGAGCVRSSDLRSRWAWRAPNISPRSPRKWPSPTACSLSTPTPRLAFLHDLPVELLWGVGPVAKARLAAAGVCKIGQLAAMPDQRLRALLGRALGAKLANLAWNCDARAIKTEHQARSAGAQSALGKRPARRKRLHAGALASCRPDWRAAAGQIAPGSGRCRYAFVSPICARLRTP